MISDLLKKVLITSNGCSNFFDSYANWFQKRIEVASDKYDAVINAMDTLQVGETDHDICIFLDNAVYSIDEVVENLSEHDYAFMINGADRTIALADSLKSELQSNMLYEKAMRCMANAHEGQDLASIFLSMTNGINLSNAASTLRDYISEVLNNERLDIKSKAITLIEDLSLSGSSTDGVNDIFHSDIYTYTGTHPAILWAIDTFDLDYQELVSKVSGVLKVAFASIGQIALEALAGIAKLVRATQSKWATNVEQGGPVFSVNAYNSVHYDNCCAQAFCQFSFPTTSLGKNTLATTFGFTREEVDHFYSLTANKPLIKIDSPFGCIYLGHYDGVLGDTIIARVLPKYMTASDAWNTGVKTTTNFNSVGDMIETWSGYNGNNQVYKYNPSGENAEFADGLYLGRKGLNLWAAVLYDQYKGLNQSLSDLETQAQNGLNSSMPSTTTQSTNKAIFKWNRDLYNGSSWVQPTGGVHYLNQTSVDAYCTTIIRGIITYAVLCESLETYAPYTVENGFYPCTYELKTDSELISSYGSMIRYATYAAIAVVVAIGIVKITKSIRLAYERTQTAYWAAINAGDAVNAAKAAKKARLLGHFTSGVSTSSSSIASGFLGTSNDVNTIIKLIAG